MLARFLLAELGRDRLERELRRANATARSAGERRAVALSRVALDDAHRGEWTHWGSGEETAPIGRALGRVAHESSRTGWSAHGGSGASAALCSVNTALPPLFVYVINLRSRAERYHKLKQLLLQLRPPCGSRQEASGTEWLRVERIEASDGRDEGRRYNPGFRLTLGGVLRWTLPHWRLLWRVRGYWTRDVTSGEAGLYLSHMRALRRIAENSQSDALHLVLEDDAFFAPSHLAERLYGLHRRLSAAVGVGGWDVVNLGPDFPEGRGPASSAWLRAVQGGPSPGILRPSYFWCSHALLVSPAGAAKILTVDREKQHIIPYDEFLPALAWTHPRTPLSALYLPKDAPLQYYGVRAPLVLQAADGVHDTEGRRLQARAVAAVGRGWNASRAAGAPRPRHHPAPCREHGGCSRPYRLGDMVKYAGTGLEGVDAAYAKMHASTIGGRYLLAARGANDFGLLRNVTDTVCGSVRVPQTVIHLRLGDVLCVRGAQGDRAYDERRPLSVAAFSARINALVPPQQAKLLLCGNHRRACIAQTRAYLAAAAERIPQLRVRLDEARADEDFCTMVNAAQFVAGRGGFSEMALHVRQLRNSTSIADPELSGYVLGGRASPTDLGGVEHEPAGGLSTAPAMGRLSRVGLGLAIIVVVTGGLKLTLGNAR